jgi:acyl-CoA thioesterase-1
MSVREALFLVTCLAAAGCTKSADMPREEPAPSPARTAPPRQDTRPAIVALGDSLSEGLGVERGRSFPDILQHKLDSNGYSYRVVNLGVSGDTTTGGLGRLDYVISLKPAIVILELGGNDGLRGIPVAASRANLERMIARLRDAGAEVLLAGMTLPPNYGADYIRKFEAIYRDLARKYDVQYIPFLMQDIASQLEADPELMQRDGIHPTAKGHSVIAETVFRYLKPMLKKQPSAAG